MQRKCLALCLETPAKSDTEAKFQASELSGSEEEDL